MNVPPDIHYAKSGGLNIAFSVTGDGRTHGGYGLRRAALGFGPPMYPQIPNPLCLNTDRGAVDLLEVPSTPIEGGDDGGWRVVFQDWDGQPLAGSYVHQIHRPGGFPGVIAIRPADAA